MSQSFQFASYASKKRAQCFPDPFGLCKIYCMWENFFCPFIRCQRLGSPAAHSKMRMRVQVSTSSLFEKGSPRSEIRKPRTTLKDVLSRALPSSWAPEAQPCQGILEGHILHTLGWEAICHSLSAAFRGIHSLALGFLLCMDYEHSQRC